MSCALEITNLSTHIQLSRSVVQAVGDVSFQIAAGETLGLVGESGCGKSMTGLSIMGLLPPGGHIVGGSIKVDGRELVGLPEPEMQRVRGNDVAMVFQDSMTSLNPTRTIGYQVAEPVRRHRGASKAEARDRALEVLDLVGLPRPRERLDDYPHQLSGGLRQRVLIALALACEPKVLIADEPTTALDVTIQAQILRLLDDLKERLGMAVLLVTHDMGVVAGRADRVAVMYAGHVVETTDTPHLFTGMRHPYTQGLLASIPQLDQDPGQALFTIPGIPPDLAHPPRGCRFADRCRKVGDRCREEEPPLDGATPDHLSACWHPVSGPLRDLPREEALARAGVPDADLTVGAGTDVGPGTDLGAGTDVGAGAVAARTGASVAPESRPLLEVTSIVKEFPVSGGGLRRSTSSVKAVSDVSFTVDKGETFGLVGESGCGKSTLGRMVVALDPPDSGHVTLGGDDLVTMRGGALRRRRRDLQLMFQDPYASLDPRMRVGAILREPLTIQGIGDRHEQDQRIADLLREVGLPPTSVERYPHEFSGGQRQRIGLARALTLNPELIVADEPVSALDVSIRSQVLNLMKRLQASHDLSYVVISHDLAVVKYLSNRIGVMYLGRLVEVGPSDAIYARPAHHYTVGLIATIPVPDPAVEKGKTAPAIRGELPSPVNPPSGCRFRTRCPAAQDLCAEQVPAMRRFGRDHWAACHFPAVPPVEGEADARTASVPETDRSADRSAARGVPAAS